MTWLIIKEFFIKRPWILKSLLYGIAAVAVILAIKFMWDYHGDAKYQQGYDARDNSCNQEKAEDNAKRQEKNIQTIKNWGAIDAKPSANPRAILDRMFNNKL